MGNILLVGPDRARATNVRYLLRQDGHVVRWLRNTDHWPDAERDQAPDLVVAAVESPDLVLGVRGMRSRGFPPPILFVQQQSDAVRDLHLDERLVDRIESPYMFEDLAGRVDALIRTRRVVHRTFDEEGGPVGVGVEGGWRGLVDRLASVLGRRVLGVRRSLQPYLEVASRIADWADRRDAFEPGHSERVATLAGMIADALGLNDSEASVLMRAAMLHDIGKVALPVEVLRQKDPLRDEQKKLIRTHPERGAALLRALDPDESTAEAILYHHEQPDGNGYYGLGGDEIPLNAAILGVAEAYDAMTSTMLAAPLRPEEAMERLRSRRGSKFHAEAVDALVGALKPAPKTLRLSPDPTRIRLH